MKNEDLLKPLKKFPLLVKNIFYSTDTSFLNLGLNKTQEAILMDIFSSNGLSMKDYQRFVSLDKSSYTRAVEFLCERGYVKKIQNSSDKRKYNLILTETGLKIAITIQKIMDNYLEEISKLFFNDEKERKKIVDALEIISGLSEKIELKKKDGTLCKKKI